MHNIAIDSDVYNLSCNCVVILFTVSYLFISGYLQIHLGRQYCAECVNHC